MPRIISPELNKKLRREYRLRFFTVLFFTCSFVILGNVIMTSSSYLLLSLYEKAYSTQSIDKKEEEFTKKNDDFNNKVLQVHSLIQKIPSQKSLADIQIVNTLFKYANSEIAIEAIEILPEPNETHVTLRGFAPTRDSLIQFQTRINQDDKFVDFNIPIDALTKQKDILFSVNFIYHEN